MKTEEQQQAALDEIDNLLDEYFNKLKSGATEEELAPIIKEVLIIYRENCPYEDLRDKMKELETVVDEQLLEIRKRLN